ncbi:HTH-type transcriptional activator RhaS [compost metagenome]|uniref:helix-turn-helix domain-containing protein n=1 Tax=Sphingobacterium faecium TaxID=34087 RepID=UPI000D390BFB|nr:helix-turn-helix transcriptional regulator [Sphingobacterium faecium]MQP29323.1 helix-turn-helix domain-containing protein [Sphingobacterium faecium]PTX13698.1 AraC-like DNA-binding protein [Sphingobacterium faecium]GEM64697.1 AraC family transcriptional regulator [Sphingobacterium faecium NBRC 15299]
MDNQREYFPVLNIQEFTEAPSELSNLLFHELRGSRQIVEPHKHDFFIILLFEQGSGSHTIDFKSYAVEQQQVHLLFPGQVHQWEFQETTVCYQLMINREWFERFLPDLRFSSLYYQQHPVFQISDLLYKALRYEFLAIAQELKDKTVLWEIIQTRSKLIGLLLRKTFELTFSDFEKYHSNPIISKFVQLIDLHFKSDRSVSFYAEKLHISANYLNIVCKKGVNIAASTLIHDRILLESKRLLKISEMSVKDIVYELGFYDHASFSKFFKNQTGMTPSQFKEQG